MCTIEVLGEDDIEARSREGQRPRLDESERNPVRKPPARDQRPRALDQQRLDVDPDHLGRVVLCDQERIDPADPGTDVEHPFAGQNLALEQCCDLLRAAGREETLAPHELERIDERLAVLRHRYSGSTRLRKASVRPLSITAAASS